MLALLPPYRAVSGNVSVARPGPLALGSKADASLPSSFKTAFGAVGASLGSMPRPGTGRCFFLLCRVYQQNRQVRLLGKPTGL